MRLFDDRRPSLPVLRSARRFVALLPFALAACATQDGYVIGGNGTVYVSEVRRATVCNSTSGAAAVTMLGDREALKAWQEAHHVDLIGDAPLAPGPYVLVEHGARNTGGYAVVVSRKAFVSDGVLYLNASFLAPIGDTLRAEMLTSPCALIAVPAGNYAVVELRDPQGRRRASSNAPPLATPALAAPAQ
jgi:hypothetical protein